MILKSRPTLILVLILILLVSISVVWSARKPFNTPISNLSSVEAQTKRSRRCDAPGSKPRMDLRRESLEIEKPQHAISWTRNAWCRSSDHSRRPTGLPSPRLHTHQPAKAEDRNCRSLKNISRKDAKNAKKTKLRWKELKGKAFSPRTV